MESGGGVGTQPWSWTGREVPCPVLASMQTQRGTPGRVLTSGLSRELCLIPAGELRVVMFKFSLFIEIVDVRCYVSGVQHRDSPFLKG